MWRELYSRSQPQCDEFVRYGANGGKSYSSWIPHVVLHYQSACNQRHLVFCQILRRRTSILFEREEKSDWTKGIVVCVIHCHIVVPSSFHCIRHEARLFPILSSTICACWSYSSSSPYCSVVLCSVLFCSVLWCFLAFSCVLPLPLAAAGTTVAPSDSISPAGHTCETMNHTRVLRVILVLRVMLEATHWW